MSSLDDRSNLLGSDFDLYNIWNVNDTDFFECTPPSWEMDSNANFSWNVSNSMKKNPLKGEKTERFRSECSTRSVKDITPTFLSPTEGGECNHPEYVHFKDRLETFFDWPKFLKGPSKEDLSRAGFIYTRIGDKVTCFSCGIILKNWDPLHDAYKEHLRWSKNCIYAKMVGDEKELQ
ncbi:death-associated inhibitor of apoptosis 1-like [Saccostrea cucullata]|uniref:death-associated inhibitor of apoptosis 1-like n=1 Tax=Saccostrea cuccullata TaxID=36930 RepID=UPI002ED6184C